MLETDGLTIDDVDVKVLPFPQMAIAFANKAIDAAIVIPPFHLDVARQRPRRQLQGPRRSGQAAPADDRGEHDQHRLGEGAIERSRNYYNAYLRGVRDYCNAYHGGKNRAAMIDLLIKTGTENRPEVLNKYPWPARDPNGRDQRREHARHAGLVQAEQVQQCAAAGGAARRYVLRRLCGAKLGPFVLENKDSKLAGCR